jgi:polyhydroxyalkanoate synthase
MDFEYPILYAQHFLSALKVQQFQDALQYYFSFARKQPCLADQVFSFADCDVHYFKSENPLHAIPILLVPSIINNASLFHLTSQHSFVQFLCAAGHDVFVLHWDLSKDHDLIAVLGRCVAYIFDHTQQTPFVGGYCLGGTIVAQWAAQYAHRAAGLFLFAPAWDFNALHPEIRLLPFNQSIIDRKDIQRAFARITPDLTIDRFIHFYQKDQSDETQSYADLFVAVQDWLQSTQSIPAPCLQKIYEGSSVVDVSAIQCPVLIISAPQDRIVPPKSIQGFIDKIRFLEKISVPYGHVGAITGRKAPTIVWPLILQWVQSNKKC